MTAIDDAWSAGGRPFEIIAGAPVERFGVRITISADRGREAAMARALGVTTHPWGDPNWVGLRVTPDGRLRYKPYHSLAALDDRFTLPPGLPDTLHPVMASLDGDVSELYLRQSAATDWTSFVDRSLGVLAAPHPVFAPHPRAAPESFCVSLKWQAARLVAVSVFADERALPPDAAIRTEWSRSLAPRDAEFYDVAYGAVRSLGTRPPRGWHAMLAWTVDASGTWQRAVSFRVPRQR